MKNKKFLGEGLEAIGYDMETYTSKLFDKCGPQFWAEFTYTNGHCTVNWDLKQAKGLVKELNNFIIKATTKEQEHKEKYGKTKKNGK